MKPLVVAHLIATNFFGGPEKQIVSHAHVLDKNRFRFVLISFVENGQPNELLDNARRVGLDVVELHTDKAFDPSAVFRLNRILADRHVNILCSHGYKANVIGRLATWIAGIPHLAVSRGWTAENRKIRFYEMLDRFFLRHANRVVAVSNGQRKKILKLGISPERVAVIHNAIDVSAVTVSEQKSSIRQELGIPQDAVLVVSAGRLSPEKNHTAMIEAARAVCATRRDIYFAVFGEGFLRADLEARISRAGLKGRFFLPGFRRDILNLFREIDIFMLPSFTEGLPNVALEAFAVSKPIVATAVGGTPEVVQHGISGFLTNPEDIQTMTGHLLQLAESRELRSQMGEAGRRFVAEHFGFERQTKNYVELYEAVHNRSHARS